MIKENDDNSVNIFPEWGSSEELELKLSFWERVFGVKKINFVYKKWHSDDGGKT